LSIVILKSDTTAAEYVKSRWTRPFGLTEDCVASIRAPPNVSTAGVGHPVGLIEGVTEGVVEVGLKVSP